MNAVERIVSVLCGPDGKCCITGSDADRAIVDDALAEMAQPEQQTLSKKTVEKLHKFLDAAAGDGLVCDGVDAADLYIEIFPENYAEGIAQPEQPAKTVFQVERVDLPDCVVDFVATSAGLYGPFSKDFYDFAQALMHEVIARVPSVNIAQPEQLRGATNKKDWREPTTFIKRFGDVMQLLCSGQRPPDEMMSAWFDFDASDSRLQNFACEYGLSWAQGIGMIDAALLLADQPTEGVDHEHRPKPIAQPEQPTPAEYAMGYSEGFNDACGGLEHNFCGRCGKRLGGIDGVHTCTPPVPKEPK